MKGLVLNDTTERYYFAVLYLFNKGLSSSHLVSIRFVPPSYEHMYAMEEERKEDIKMPLPKVPRSIVPDGGWGWVVVFASFMCNLTVGKTKVLFIGQFTRQNFRLCILCLLTRHRMHKRKFCLVN